MPAEFRAGGRVGILKPQSPRSPRIPLCISFLMDSLFFQNQLHDFRSWSKRIKSLQKIMTCFDLATAKFSTELAAFQSKGPRVAAQNPSCLSLPSPVPLPPSILTGDYLCFTKSPTIYWDAMKGSLNLVTHEVKTGFCLSTLSPLFWIYMERKRGIKIDIY